MTVNDNTIQAESLGDLFKIPAKKGPNVLKMMAKNLLSNPGRAFTSNSKNSYSSSFSKFQTGSINITRVDNTLQHRKGSSPW